MRYIKPLPFEMHNDVLKLTTEFIEKRKVAYSKQIEELKLNAPLGTYVSIADGNGFCIVAVDKKLPEWLQKLLEHCYADATEQLAMK